MVVEFGGFNHTAAPFYGYNNAPEVSKVQLQLANI